MATKTQAKKATQSAKKTTQTAKKAATQATQTTKQAERTVRTFVTDSAYAAVGVGDTAVELLRSLPEQVDRFRKDVPKTVETRVKDVERRVKGVWTETPEEFKARAESLRKGAETEFAGYAKRGRSVIDSVTKAKATQRAIEQSKAARSQVKAATTSVRKAFGQSVEAVESAADKVGDEQRAR